MVRTVLVSLVVTFANGCQLAERPSVGLFSMMKRGAIYRRICAYWIARLSKAL